MALTFSQLVTPLTTAQELALLTAALQGVGFITQSAPSGAPVGSGQIGCTGPAQVAAQVVIKITTSGQLGTGAFSFSLDGGQTFTGPQTIPANGNFVLPTVGVVLAFSNGLYTPAGGSFQGNETYSFQTAVPTFPITNWTPGGVANTLIQIDAQALSSLSNVIALIGAGGLVATSTGPWLDLLASNLYNLNRGQPLSTIGSIVLVCNASAGPYVIQPGQLFATDMTNNYVFFNITGNTLGTSSSITLLFQAVTPGAASAVPSYNPATPLAGGIVALTTPLPGVTISNPVQANPPLHIGPGTGTLVTSGTPVSDGQTVIVTIKSTGAPGAGTFSYSINGGTPVGPATIPSSSFPFGATGVNGLFTGTFLVGDQYIFTTSWITQRGVDTESDSSLQQRCVNQWGTLAPGTPAGVYINWAKLASPEVVFVAVNVDPTTPGQVDVTIAGSADQPVSGAAVALVQAYIDARTPLTSACVVSNVTTFAISVTGSVFCPAASQAAVLAAIPSALTNVQIAAGIGGIVYYSEIEQALSNIAGVRNLEGILANGATTDIALTSTQVAAISSALTVVPF